MALTRRVIGKYAGEFALIVVGVVTALAAESWISDLAERSQAGDVLGRLAEDLRADAYEAGRRVTYYTRVSERGRVVFDGLTSTRPLSNPSEFLVWAFDASRIFRMTLSSPTWDDLSATGRLHLLDPEVRLAVSQYYRTRSEVDNAINALDLEYRRKVRSILPVELQDYANRECEWWTGLDSNTDRPCPFEMADARAAELVAQLRRDPEIRMDLNWYRAQITTAIQIFEGVAGDAEDLVTLVTR